MGKMSKIMHAMKQPEILATIGIVGAAAVAGKVMIGDYLEKANNAKKAQNCDTECTGCADCNNCCGEPAYDCDDVNDTSVEDCDVVTPRENNVVNVL